MKHLTLIINEMYPNRMFSLKEEYNRDEAFNIVVEYTLNIEDVIIKHFKNFNALEQCVYDLYERDGLKKVGEENV